VHFLRRSSVRTYVHVHTTCICTNRRAIQNGFYEKDEDGREEDEDEDELELELELESEMLR